MMPPLAILGNMSPVELIIILIVLLVLFGHKLPNAMRSLGSSVSEFKKGVKDGENETPGGGGPKTPQAPQQPQQLAQPLSQIKCGVCGTIYLPAAVGAPCPGCGSRPRVMSAAEKN
ncbi:MAG: twin-arginine translocase TatA/TatE family subunit [Planctomycetota bacterium]